MAKLPTRDDLSQAPSARSGRPIATYDITAIGKGQAAIGKAIADLGATGMEIVRHQERQDEYDAELKFQQFKWDEATAQEDAMRNVEPGQAGRFAEDWSTGYRERSGEFLKGLPEAARQKYALKTTLAERELYRPAAEFTRKEQKRVADNGLDDFRERYTPRSGDPQAVERFKADWERQVDLSPWLTPIEKDERKRKGLRDIEATHVTTLLSDRTKAGTVLRDLGFDGDVDAPAPGAPEAATAPEEQASKGIGGAVSAPPAARPGVTPISFRLETGKTDPLKGVANISRDSKGSHSYGNFGLNSLPGASAHQFAAEYGEALGLQGEPGTAEFDNSWKEVARADPNGLHQAEMDWWNKTILPRVTVDLGHAGVSDDVATDPRVQAYFADRLVQYGPASIGNHEKRIGAAFEKSGGDAERFLRQVSEADRDSLEGDFPSALRTGAYSRRGHDNRVYGRLNLALAGAGSGEGAKLPSAADTYSGPYRHLTAEDRLRLATTARATLRQEAAEVRDSVRDFEGIAEKGFTPPPGQFEALRKRVEAGGDAETRQSFAQAASIMTWQDVARKATPEQVDAFVRSETERLREGGATPFEVKRLGMADNLLTNMRQELKSDPLGWADRVGHVAIQPVDFTTPENAQASLTLRVQQADSVAKRYGIEPKYLRDDERQALTTAIEAGGEETLRAAWLIAQAAGDRAPAVLAEVSKNSPTAAIIGGMVTENGLTGAARDAADGIALRKEAGFQTLAPSKTDARIAVTSVLGAALSGMPKTETAFIDATNAIYEVRARKQQLTQFDPGVWQQALKEAIGEREIDGKVYGGIVENNLSNWRGERKIILPSFVAKDSWREVIEATTLQDLWQAGLGVPSGGDGQPVSIGRVKGATLVQSGDGRYKLSLGDPDTPGGEKWIKRQDAPDEIFEIDLNRLRPFLERRRPELFAGAPGPWRTRSTVAGFEPSGEAPW